VQGELADLDKESTTAYIEKSTSGVKASPASKTASKTGSKHNGHSSKKKDHSSLGESAEVGVGTGDTMLAQSIMDGTALKRFHSGYNALKFAYDHDSPQQKRDLVQLMEEQPDTFQESKLQATMRHFQKLASRDEHMEHDELMQEMNVLSALPTD